VKVEVKITPKRLGSSTPSASAPSDETSSPPVWPEEWKVQFVATVCAQPSVGWVAKV